MKLLLIDGLNLLRRIYAAQPEAVRAAPTADPAFIRHCCASLTKALHQHQPSHALTMFDAGGKTWRHTLYPEYKAARPPMPTPLQQALPAIQVAFAELGVRDFSLAPYEADDLLASVATRAAAGGVEVIILSSDRGLCQLLGSSPVESVGSSPPAPIRIFDHFAGIFLDSALIQQKFAVAPAQLPDLFALVGEPGVSIRGVPAIGRKTAATLLQQYGDLPTLLQNITKISGRIGKNLAANAAQVEVARQLFQVKTDLDLGLNLQQYRVIRAASPTAP